MQLKFRSTQKKQAARMAGITLLELMIVVIIVGILAAIAYPSYQAQMQKTRRADGKSVLMQTAQTLERCNTRFASYTGGPGAPDACPVAFPINSPEQYYVVNSVPTAATYTLSAAPQGTQAADTDCGTLVLDDAGQQGSQGVATSDANGCW